MQQEEARQAEVADHAQLLLEPGDRVRATGIALLELGPAQLGQPAIGRRVLRAGVAVAEVLGQVELEPLGQPQRLGDRVGMIAKALRHVLGRSQHVGGVAAALGLGLVERGAQPDGDHRVLQRDAVARVSVHVAGGHAWQRRGARPARRGAGCDAGRDASRGAGARFASGRGRRSPAGAGRPRRRPGGRPPRRARPPRRRARSPTGRRAPRRSARRRRASRSGPRRARPGPGAGRR